MTAFENELAKSLKFYLKEKEGIDLSELKCIELAQKISPELKSFIKEEKDYIGDISKNKSVAPLVGVIDRRVFEEKDTLKSIKEQWFDF